MTSSLDPPEVADRYWRTVCLLAATHVLGLTWPPPGGRQRACAVGHWGCNPGIAWTVGHLAAHWRFPEPFLLVLGTGHATSFAVAHQALCEDWSGEEITAVSARYGQPAGDPSELIGAPDVPYLGGELGPALAVSQAMAASQPLNRLTVCIVGDGECETPSALAALAHRGVVLDGHDRGAWLAVVNANGARMSGAARFDPPSLRRLLAALGYRVVLSGADLGDASAAARVALRQALRGQPVVWLSVTEKGWPLPESLAGRLIRGYRAHKLGPIDAAMHDAIRAWMTDFRSEAVAGRDGRATAEVVRLARRASLQAPAVQVRRSAAHSPACLSSSGRTNPPWTSPGEAVDVVLATRGTVVFSPDEGESNRLRSCLSAGLVREVLAEEVCAAWTWGTVEAGREAAFVTYEAFAPLTSSLLAQYAKMVHTRPRCGRPPLLVLLSSLSWANSPTHQNSDLVGTVLARPWPRMYLICPIGAGSAARRTEQLLDRTSDAVAVVVCSKQPLLDVADPGGVAVELRIADGRPPVATVLAVGDICVTEAVAAMAALEVVGVGVRVVAAVDLRGMQLAARSGVWAPLAHPGLIGTAWCAPGLVAPTLWQAAGRTFPILGYQERWGPTAWETLCANRVDRVAVVEELAGLGIAIPRGLSEAMRQDLDLRHRSDLPSGVPAFDCPTLTVGALGDLTTVPA